MRQVINLILITFRSSEGSFLLLINSISQVADLLLFFGDDPIESSGLFLKSRRQIF